MAGRKAWLILKDSKKRRFLRPASYTTHGLSLITGPTRFVVLNLSGVISRPKLVVAPYGWGPNLE